MDNNLKNITKKNVFMHFYELNFIPVMNSPYQKTLKLIYLMIIISFIVVYGNEIDGKEIAHILCT